MITTYQSYPSGFRVPVVTGFRTDTAGDPQVAEFMRVLSTSRTTRVNSWEFRRNVLITAMKLFGDFREFLAAQEDNAAISPHQRNFLTDTLQYINCGKRPFSVRMRMELIQAERLDGYNTWPTRPMGLFQKLMVPVEDYMYCWQQHDQGFIDLVCTLNLIFGEPTQSGFHPD